MTRIWYRVSDLDRARVFYVEKLGFTETGRDRLCYDLYDGSIVDLVRFDLLKHEMDGRQRRSRGDRLT